MQSRHQPCIWSSYDISLKGECCSDNNSTEEVATTPGCRDNICKEKRSRQHLVVATTVAKRRGRDNIRRSRQQVYREEVATTPGCRDNSCKDQNVATSISCRDVSFTEKMSRQEQAVTTPPSLKTCRNNTRSTTRPATRLRQALMSRRGLSMSRQYQSTGLVY